MPGADVWNFMHVCNIFARVIIPRETAFILSCSVFYTWYISMILFWCQHMVVRLTRLNFYNYRNGPVWVNALLRQLFSNFDLPPSMGMLIPFYIIILLTVTPVNVKIRLFSMYSSTLIICLRLSRVWLKAKFKMSPILFVKQGWHWQVNGL